MVDARVVNNLTNTRLKTFIRDNIINYFNYHLFTFSISILCVYGSLYNISVNVIMYFLLFLITTQCAYVIPYKYLPTHDHYKYKMFTTESNSKQEKMF